MAFFMHSDFGDSYEVVQLSERREAGAVSLWAMAGSWASAKLTGGIVPSGAVRILGHTPACAAELVRVGLWSEHPVGYEFFGATAAYEAVDMTSKRRPKREVILKLCKLPSKAFHDWHKIHGLAPNRYIDATVRAEVLRVHGMTCWLCRKPILTKKDLHLDHVVPRSDSGTETAENLRPAHARCNVIRGARSPEVAARLIARDEEAP
jgi:hypothetical protein